MITAAGPLPGSDPISRFRRIGACLVLFILGLAACGDGQARPRAEPAGQAVAQGAHATGSSAPVPSPVKSDSILPMDTMIARFQADLPEVTSFGAEAATSIDELVMRFAAAVRDSSTGALDAVTLDAAEFAYLYFPTSIYSRQPYAQPPAVNRLLLEQNSLKGRARLLREYGGRPLAVESHDCAGEPIIEGENRIHDHCVLRIRGSDGEIVEVRMFGSVIERQGRFKLMSLANRL